MHALQRRTVRDGDRASLDTDQAGALPFAQALVDGLPGGSDEIAELALGELQLDGRLSQGSRGFGIRNSQQGLGEAHRQLQQRDFGDVLIGGA